jgi:hypothetical protein
VFFAFALQFCGQAPALFAQELQAVLLLAQVSYAVLGQPHRLARAAEGEDPDDEGRGAHEEHADAHEQEHSAQACFRHHPKPPFSRIRAIFACAPILAPRRQVGSMARALPAVNPEEQPAPPASLRARLCAFLSLFREGALPWHRPSVGLGVAIVLSCLLPAHYAHADL